jgi:hypothetical protein
MLERIITEAMREAGIDAVSFDKAIRKAGYKNRLAWLLAEEQEAVLNAYNDRVAAEKAEA